MYKIKEKTGFTLAEVLITLLIIGIVSSIVIPALINDTQNAELQIAWKKEYAVASVAWKKAIIDNGGIAPGDLYGLNNDKTRWNAFKAQFNIIKDCSVAGKAVGNCWAKNTVTPDSAPGGCSCWSSSNQRIRGTGFVSNDGTYWLVYEEYPGNRTITFIAVDVNGEKSPNKWNKDVFSLALLDNGVGSPGVCTNVDGSTTSRDYLTQ